MMPLLHVLDTGGRTVEQALALAQLGPQGGNVAGGIRSSTELALELRLQALGIRKARRCVFARIVDLVPSRLTMPSLSNPLACATSSTSVNSPANHPSLAPTCGWRIRRTRWPRVTRECCFYGYAKNSRALCVAQASALAGRDVNNLRGFEGRVDHSPRIVLAPGPHVHSARIHLPSTLYRRGRSTGVVPGSPATGSANARTRQFCRYGEARHPVSHSLTARKI
jgi:hypothetical protein